MKLERAVVCAAVVALHAGIYLLITIGTIEKRRERLTPGEVWVVPLPITPAAPPPIPRPPSRASRSAGHETPSSHESPAPGPPGSPESLPPIQPSLTPPASAPDWAQEAEDVAEKSAQAQVDSERRAGALASRYKSLPRPYVPRPGFGWDNSAVHRVGPQGAGATVIHINDRCAIAFFLIVPIGGGCGLGKIEPRGDLFSHLHDPPQFGDWDDRGKIP
jgi:hypothetical protein